VSFDGHAGRLRALERGLRPPQLVVVIRNHLQPGGVTAEEFKAGDMALAEAHRWGRHSVVIVIGAGPAPPVDTSEQLERRRKEAPNSAGT
jgi:hypothetical protein